VNGPGFELQEEIKNFLFSATSVTSLDPPILFYGCGGSFLGLTLAGREADNPPPFGAAAMNEWSCTSAPSISLYGVNRLYLRIVACTTQIKTKGKR
jgi:hypothetical protein